MFRKIGRGSARPRESLPEERKNLAERYTIDAEEAELRAEGAAEAEEQARREAAEEQARREAAEQARLAAEEQVRRQAEEQARVATKERARREAAEERTRREAAEQARLAAEEQARLEATQDQARREAEEQAREAEASDRRLQAAPDSESPARELLTTDAFPIYDWLERSNPEPSATPDWPRSLVKAKDEARTDETSKT